MNPSLTAIEDVVIAANPLVHRFPLGSLSGVQLKTAYPVGELLSSPASTGYRYGGGKRRVLK